MKTCNKCGSTLDLSDFRICKYPNGAEYHKAICKSCERASARQYSSEHKVERREYTKNFVVQNPDYIKNWKKENREYLLEQERERRSTDIQFRLKKNVSRAIRHAIDKRHNSTVKYLSYTMDELKQHLESQFDNKMTWDNYGTYWHIDHVIPHSLFSYTSMEDDDFKKCWSLENLRPLEARQNQSDGATRVRHKR